MQPTTDEIVAVSMVIGLIIIAGSKRILDRSGLIAATVVGLSVSLLGHWTWLVILVVFLSLGSVATAWRYEEKQQLRLAEANEGARGWRNVVANGGVEIGRAHV